MTTVILVRLSPSGGVHSVDGGLALDLMGQLLQEACKRGIGRE